MDLHHLEAFLAVADAYKTKSGVDVALNAVDHNTFQENINTYLQGSPDDVFTWFAGYRMNQFAESGLISDVSSAWPIDGLADSFKQASTASEGKQYFVPTSYYPSAVFYLKSTFEKGGYEPPTTLDELTTLMKKMQADGIEKAALIGTRNVMTEKFYRQRLVAHGISLLPPDMELAERIDRIVYDELTIGKVSRESERYMKSELTDIAKENVQAAILACTELEMIVDVKANVLPIYDTTRIHVAAGVEWILGDAP